MKNTFSTVCSIFDKGYRYGFNGKEKDNEISLSGGDYDFGARIFDSRIGRFLSIDPKAGEAATWSPYNFAIDNPIVFVDRKGLWPGITFFYLEFEAGAGIAWGINYVEQSGIAYDEVGKTHYTMVSAISINNQQLIGESSNPQLIIGASISFTLNVKQNWSAETFAGMIGKGGISHPIPVDGKFGEAIAINIGFNSDEFVIGGGLGVGIKISYLNTSISESISLTDKEADKVSDATDVITESWVITGKTAIKDKKGNITGYQANVSTYNTKGKLINTGIKVTSGILKDSDGTIKSNGVWSSSDYQKESAAAEIDD